MKYKYKTTTAPQPPAIIPQDCSAENNSVTVAWQAPNHSHVEGYVLELDDGSGGEFRVSTHEVLLFECIINYILNMIHIYILYLEFNTVYLSVFSRNI